MTKSEKRVQIAQDVLKRLQFLNVQRGQYIDIQKPLYKEITEDLQKHLTCGAKLEKKCDVCAKGAMFLSYVRFYDKYTLEDVAWYYEDGENYAANGADITFAMTDIFDREQLDLIEQYFESSKSVCWNNPCHQHFYADKYPDAKDRLRAIMKNIVRNKGIFKPEQDV